MGKFEIFSEVRNEPRVSTLPIPIQYSTGTPSQSNKAGERKKRHSNRKEINQNISICR
jgi:hypothetical protein